MVELQSDWVGRYALTHGRFGLYRRTASVVLHKRGDQQATVWNALRAVGKRQRGKELKRKIIALEDDLRSIVAGWTQLGSVLSVQGFRYLVTNDSIDVRNPSAVVTPPSIPGVKYQPQDYWQQVRKFDKASFNGEHIFSRLSDLEDAKVELADVVKYCKDAGDPLD